MDYKAIQELIREMSQSGLYSLEIETEGIHIKMQKGPEQQVIAQTVPVAALTPVQTVQAEAVSEPAIAEPRSEAPAVPKNNEKIVTSPIVGTFYGAASPDAPAFAKVGDKVKKGQVLCIIEAMKLMNEIESDYDGEVVEVLVQNEQMVQFGQGLFKIRV